MGSWPLSKGSGCAAEEKTWSLIWATSLVADVLCRWVAMRSDMPSSARDPLVSAIAWRSCPGYAKVSPQSTGTTPCHDTSERPAMYETFETCNNFFAQYLDTSWQCWFLILDSTRLQAETITMVFKSRNLRRNRNV